MKKRTKAVATNTKLKMAYRGMSRPFRSYPYVYNPFYDQKPGYLRGDGEKYGVPAPCHAHKLLYIPGGREIEKERHEYRGGGEYVARGPRLGRVDPDLAFNPDPLPYGARQPLEYLTEVSAYLAVDVHGEDKKPQVRAVHPGVQVLERFPQGKPEDLFLVQGLEKAGGRFRGLRGHELYGGAEGVARLE